MSIYSSGKRNNISDFVIYFPIERAGLVGFSPASSPIPQLLTFSPSLDEGFIRNYNINRKQKKTRAVNWCLKGCVANYLSLRTSAHTGVAIPRLVRKCTE